MKKIYFLATCCLAMCLSACSGDNYEYVDLGLPSGTMWATCNIGATKPEEFGDYYAWGETTTKDYYGVNNYKWRGRKSIDGYTYAKTTLDLSDDAAAANWGGKWRMPTDRQYSELVDECYWVWTDSYNGSNVAGYIVYKAKAEADKYKARDYLRSIFGEEAPEPTSSYDLSDVHIFLPAAGCRMDKGEETGLFWAGSGGFYWSSTRSSQDSHDAYGLGFISDRIGVDEHKPAYLFIGKPVRAVIPGK